MEAICSSLQWSLYRKGQGPAAWSQILPGRVPMSSFCQVPKDLGRHRGRIKGNATCYGGTEPRGEKGTNCQASQQAQHPLSSSFSLQVWSKDKAGVGRTTPPFTFFCSSGTFRDGTSLQQRPHCFMRD